MAQTASFDDSHTITLIGSAPGVSNRLLKPGEVIGGSYRLKSLLGQGGMGYVFCAEHTTLQHDYALKMLAPEQLNKISRERFELEGRAIARLDHANIVKVYNMGLDAGDCPYYVMDLLDGTALSDYIETNQTLAFEECLDVFIQIASGLGYAHSKGIVHRDVKPSNVVLLIEKNGRLLAKIVDFGIAKLLPSANLQKQSQTATGQVFGSPLYMSPEQSMGAAVDQRTDIYSLGCAFFEALTGGPPYHGSNAIATLMMHQDKPIPSILEARPEMHLPQSVDLLLSKMMAKLPEDRYQSMDLLIQDLEYVKQGKAIGPVSPQSSAQTPTVGAAGRSLLAVDFTVGAATPLPATDFTADAARPLPATDFTAGDFTAGGVIVGDPIASDLTTGGVKQGEVLKDDLSDRGHRVNRWVRWGALPLLAVSICAGGLIFGFQRQPFLPTSKPGEDLQDILSLSKAAMLNNDTTRAEQAFKQCGEIKSEIVDLDGRRQRKFVFPEWSIGKISNTQSSKFTGANLAIEPFEAIGTKYTQPGVPLKLEICKGQSSQVINQPSIVDKIGADEFSELYIARNPFWEGDLQSPAEKTETASLIHILKDASKWSNLTCVTIGLFSLNQEVLDLFKDFHHLQYLLIDKSKWNGANLASESYLGSLKGLGLDTTINIEAICHKLANSPNLEQLRLVACKITPEFLSELRSCSKLSYLELQEPNFSPLVSAVNRLATLHIVAFRQGKLSVEQMRSITARPNINKLLLSDQEYSAEEKARLHNFLPKVSFENFGRPR